MAAKAAATLRVDPYQVAVASTGVIGVPMPMDRILPAIERIVLSEGGWDDASRAIMTTDTTPKVAQREVALSGGTVRIGGMAKGAGMIHPNMATMLAFVTTDAAVEPGDLRRIVSHAADTTFNAISVDGDTSTNDTLLVLANGASGVTPKGADLAAFEEGIHTVCADLARMIVADGEGATKVFEVRVRGAVSAADARLAARTITNSNLVRTAIHGGDPNWGRVLAAAGRSGARVDDRRASVRIGDLFVYRNGAPIEVADKDVRALFAADAVEIEVTLGLGDGQAVAWGCDLSAEYVRINAEYMT
jgi:glutamate N-acetyltransferase/amino-acid N-acetyltransferase